MQTHKPVSWAFTFNNPMHGKELIEELVDQIIATVLEKLANPKALQRSVSCPCFGQQSLDIDDLSETGSTCSFISAKMKSNRLF